MATGVHIDSALLRKIEDALVLKVCVWKLTALMSHKRQIITHVAAPKSPATLFRLAKKLEFPFSLDKLQTVSRSCLKLYKFIPVVIINHYYSV